MLEMVAPLVWNGFEIGVPTNPSRVLGIAIRAPVMPVCSDESAAMPEFAETLRARRTAEPIARTSGQERLAGKPRGAARITGKSGAQAPVE